MKIFESLGIGFECARDEGGRIGTNRKKKSDVFSCPCHNLIGELDEMDLRK